jgi:hypothetical protein
MANITGVSIDIDLGISEAMDEIAELKTSLQTLNDDINIDVDVNRDQLDKLKNDLDNIDDEIEVTKRVKETSVKGDGEDEGTDITPSKETLNEFVGQDGPQDRSRRFRPSDAEEATTNFRTSFSQLENIAKDRERNDLVEGLTIDVDDASKLLAGRSPSASDPSGGLHLEALDPKGVSSLLGDKGGDIFESDNKVNEAIRPFRRERRDYSSITGDKLGGFIHPSVDRLEKGEPRVDFDTSKGIKIDKEDFRREFGDLFDMDLSTTSDSSDSSDSSDGSKSNRVSKFLSNLLPNLDKSVKSDEDDFDVGGGLRKLIPTNMRMWYSVLALMMPLLIAMAGALAGVASAMGGVAIAGGALIGLGLVGHGEDMGEAFSNAKEQLSQLGKEIFNVMQNPAKKFAPIQEEIFAMIPGEMTGLAESLEGITVFEDLIKSSIKGAIGWLEALVDMFIENKDAVTDITETFGNLIGHGIIDFFEYVIGEGSNSQNALIQVGHALKTILLIIYNVSKAVSGLLIPFQILFDVLLFVSELLNNKVVMSVLSAIVVFGVLVGTMVKLNALMLAFGSGAVLTGIFNIIYAVGGLTKALLGALGIASQLAVTLGTIAALTGAGILAVVGGVATYKKLNSEMSVDSGDRFSGPASKMGGGDTINNTNITVEGDADRGAREDMKDTYQDERSIEDTRTYPQ